jgi:hypothetical protein
LRITNLFQAGLQSYGPENLKGIPLRKNQPAALWDMRPLLGTKNPRAKSKFRLANHYGMEIAANRLVLEDAICPGQKQFLHALPRPRPVNGYSITIGHLRQHAVCFCPVETSSSSYSPGKLKFVGDPTLNCPFNWVYFS